MLQVADQTTTILQRHCAHQRAVVVQVLLAAIMLQAAFNNFLERGSAIAFDDHRWLQNKYKFTCKDGILTIFETKSSVITQKKFDLINFSKLERVYIYNLNKRKICFSGNF